MAAASLPADEACRIDALQGYSILDTPAEPAYDAFVRLASRICETPIALVSLIDTSRQWFKANVGLPGVAETPRAHAFCAHAILAASLLEVEDTAEDERFADNVLVLGPPYIRFYAGVPLIDPDGRALGTLCVLDTAPKRLSADQRERLGLLGTALTELIVTRAAVPQSSVERMATLDAAIDVASEAIAIYNVTRPDEPTIIAHVNRAFTELFHYGRDEIIGAPVTVLYGATTDSVRLKRTRDAIYAGRSSTEIVDLYDRDGIAHTVEFRARLIDGGDVSARWIATYRDITRLTASQRLLEQQAARNRALCLIAAAVSQSDLQIDAALDLGLASLHAHWAYVGAIDDGRLSIVNSVGTDALYPPGFVIPLETTYVREAVETDDILAIDDIEATGRERPGLPRYPGWHGYITAPIKINGATFGVIGFLSRDVQRYGELDRDFVKLVAVLVGASLERQQQQEQLDSLAYYDNLTGLSNRAMLFDRLEAILEGAKREPHSFALHYIDLDDFKAVNDGSGHAAGDRVLREVARRLRQIVRASDIVARLGGDEFVILQTKLAHVSEADMLRHRIILAMRAPFETGERSYHVGASVGVSVYPDDATVADALLSKADAALYRAKAAIRSGDDPARFAELHQARADNG